MSRLRFTFFLLITSFVLVGFSDTVFYSNFEFGQGYLYDGAYKAWPIGVYITMPRVKAVEHGYKVGYNGDESVIAGVKDVSQTPPPKYVALIYRGGFSLSHSSTDPMLNGVPYKGGSGPVSIVNGQPNYNGNIPAQGPLFDNIYPNPSGDDLQFADSLKSAFVAYNSSGQPVMYTITNVDGQYYLADGSDNLAVPITDIQNIPVYYKNDNGDLVQGYYNSVTGGFSQSSGGSGDSSADMTPVIDSVASAATAIVNADNSNHQALRALLVSQLGDSGHSWVYDSKLSLESLVQFANDTGVKIRFPSNFDLTFSRIDSNIASLNQKDFSPTVNVAAPVVNVSPPEVNVSVNPPEVNVAAPEVNIDLSGVRSDLSSLQTGQSTGLTRLSSIHNDLYNYLRPDLITTRQILESWNTGNELSNLPQPDFGDDSPDDDLPSYVVSAWQNELSDSSMSQVFGDMVSWGDNGSPTQIVPDFLSGFLTSWVGAIPSVGSDAHMFDVNFELPYIGLITKSFSWSDYPYISDFRAFLVWVLYLFFGLSCFKLLHKTFI